MAGHLISEPNANLLSPLLPHIKLSGNKTQEINNEIRRCYPKRNRAACFVCGRLFLGGCLSVLDCDVHSRTECAEIKPREGGAGKQAQTLKGELQL